MSPAAPNFLDSIYSRQDLKELILHVRAYAKWYSQASVKEKYAPGQTPSVPTLMPAAVDVIKEWHLNQQVSKQSLGELIAELEDLAAAARSITITLAAPAPGDLRKKLVAWCRQNIGPTILVDFKFNSNILGGMVVSYGSHIHDWSFRRQILANLDHFPEVLRNV